MGRREVNGSAIDPVDNVRRRRRASGKRGAVVQPSEASPQVEEALIQPLLEIGRAIHNDVGDILTRSLWRQVREALLEGRSVVLPGIGHFQVRDRRRYGLVNPSSGETALLGGERTITYRPDKSLLRDLNTHDGDV